MQHMQLLPCTKYTQSNFVDTLKGKRKAVDEIVTFLGALFVLAQN